MLTNSQTWRRANARYSKHKLNRTEEYLQYCLNKNDKNINNILIADTYCSKNLSIKRVKSEIEEVYNDVFNESNFLLSSSITITKTLTFDSQVKVYLIPNRNDFIALFSELFWQREDYHFFKEDAHKELQTYWKSNKSSVREAITALYQPVVFQINIDETENTPTSTMMKKSLMTHNDSVNNFASLMELSHQSDISLDINQAQSISTDNTDDNIIQLNSSIDKCNKINMNKHVKGLISHKDSIGNLANMILEDENLNNIEIIVSKNSEKLDINDALYLDMPFKQNFLSHNDSVHHLGGSFSDAETIQSDISSNSITIIMEDDCPGLDII